MLSAIALLAIINAPGIPMAPPVTGGTVKYSESEMTAVSLPHTYSEAAKLTEEAQKEILGRFVNRLLENAKDPPQEAIDILNRHFWDLL
jgi:hypothetical protein